MKLAISNIAWRADEDEAVAELLPRAGFTGVEIAPPRVWKHPLEATSAEVKAHRTFWQERGLPIVALQSLLFGHPELTLFESAEARRQTLAYLTGMIHLAEQLGARVLVFGSPKNRKRGALAPEQALTIAADFFHELGNAAVRLGVTFCVEPNPTFYDCDFVTTSTEGLELVERVHTPGFGLHLDAGAITLAGEDPAQALSQAKGKFVHFHASEKNLAPVGIAKTVDHERFSRLLKETGYNGWVSVEMRPGDGNNIPTISETLQCVSSVYGR